MWLSSPSHWLLVPGHTSVLGWLLPYPRTVSTHSHSLCSFYFKEEVIKSMYSLKTVEKVSKKAPKSIGWGRRVAQVSIIPGVSIEGLGTILAAVMTEPGRGRLAGRKAGGEHCLAS